MEIAKAVITAASPKQRTLPLQTLVDRDGAPKTALQIILEEILETGVTEICVVIYPGDQNAYRQAAGALASRLHFVEQPQPRGYGHAVHCAADFAADAPFLLLVGDHLYSSRNARTCAEQLVAAARAEACSVSAVHATHESKLPYYGTVGGRLAPGANPIYEVERVIEKPTPTEAEQKLIVPGLRAGHYLCFFGMHVLTPAVMSILADKVRHANGSVPLTPALDELVGRERYLALELHGRRFDIGVKHGLLMAQLALALDGSDRDEVLSGLVELLAARK